MRIFMGEYEENIVFRTDKYVFRKFTMDNFDEFRSLNMDSEAMRYVNHNGGKPKTYKECVQKYNDMAYSQDKFGYSYWAVYSRGSDFLGQCGALKTWASDSITFCYAFQKKYWGKGIGTEVCSIVLDYLFRNFPTMEKLVTTALDENEASIKILRKIGFEYTHSNKEYGMNLEFFEIRRTDYAEKNIQTIS
ncbi:MAG: GNAT family N-acetyltransferase [Rickettsiales bacterium]|jgi:ribosomal-protein-alanine N-acetyltransferase|nr:GNAT family N-acetyltransferase [Rickettsiales bacterium]